MLPAWLPMPATPCFHLFLHVAGEEAFWHAIPKAGWATQPPQEFYTTLHKTSELLKSASDVLHFCQRQGRSTGAQVR